jgi:hypothetical protein
MAMRAGFFPFFFDECFGCCGIPRSSKTVRRIMAFKGCVGDYWIMVASCFLPSDVLCFFAEFR